MIFTLVGAASGGGIGYLLFGTWGAIAGGVFGGLVGFLSGAMLRVGATADRMNADVQAQDYKAKNPTAERIDPQNEMSKLRIY